MEISIILLAILVVLLVLFLTSAIRIVPEYQRLVIFRLGRCIGAKGPGLVLLIPIMDRPVRVDLRELFLQIPHQTCITRDNAPISIDFLVYRRVMVTEADGHREAAIKIVLPMEFTAWLRPLLEAGASPRGATGV